VTGVTQATIPAVGTAAPDFTLPSTSGEAVTLSALRGRKVLIAFFPLAFTSTCTVQLCAMSEDHAALEATGAKVLPISVDSVPTLQKFKAEERLTVDLLSDFKRVVSRLYGVLLEDRYHSARAYILIDAAGVIRWNFVESQSGRYRSTAELLEQLAAA